MYNASHARVVDHIGKLASNLRPGRQRVVALEWVLRHEPPHVLRWAVDNKDKLASLYGCEAIGVGQQDFILRRL
jgi:hypothetical protein